MLICAAARWLPASATRSSFHRSIDSVPSSAEETTHRPGTLAGIVVSLRPKQWIKNLVVFAALIFAQRLTEADLLIRALIAFVLFCAMSGAIYLINDLFDADRDRMHPQKALRPIASGALGAAPAIAAASVLILAALLTGFTISPPLGAVP